MHSLHAQNLIIALFIIKHGSREIIEDIVVCKQPAVGLIDEIDIYLNLSVERQPDLNPFMPDEKSVTIVVWWVKIVDIHGTSGLRA